MVETYKERMKRQAEASGISSTYKDRAKTFFEQPEKEAFDREAAEKKTNEYLSSRATVMREQILSRQEAPTYEDMYQIKKGTGLRTTRPKGMFAPKQEVNQDAVKHIYKLAGKEYEEAKKNVFSVIGGALGTLLTGTGVDKNRSIGVEAPTLGKSISEKGLVGFLYGESLKTGTQLTAERYNKLTELGVNPNRAFDIANAWEGEGDAPIDLTDSEKKAMKSYTAWRAGFVALEMADLLLVGKPVNAALKASSRGIQHQLFQEIAKAESAAQARKIVEAMRPELAGTEGVEQLIEIGRQARDVDSWSKTLRDTKIGNEILAQREGTQAVRSTTDAQQIFYQNGVPVIRGAAKTPVDQLVGLRDEIRNVLRGEGETTRLSNADIFADEVKAGSIPFNTKMDDTLEVFTTSKQALTPGERVAFSKEVAESVSERGVTRAREVLPDDLVRLQDGTFVYAPKRSLKADIEPSIKAIRGEQRARVQRVERQRAESKVREVAKAREAQAAKAAAAQKAAIEQTKAVAQARKTIEGEGAVAKKRVTELRADEAKRISEVREATNQASKAVTAARQNLDELLKQVGKKQQELGKARDKFRKKLDAVKGKKRLDGKGRDKLRVAIRKERDAELKRIELKYKALGKELEKSRTVFSKADEALKAIPDKNETIAGIKAEAKQAVDDITTGTQTKLTEAQRIIDEAGDIGAETKADMNKPVAVRAGDKATKSVEDSKVYDSVIDDVEIDYRNGPTRPLDSKGKKKLSRSRTRILNRGEDALRRYGLKENEAHLLPQEYQASTNKAQVEKALERVYKNPEQAYRDYMELPTGQLADTTNAALFMALREHEIIRANPLRARLLEKKYGVEGTRIAQEQQARVMLGSQDKGAILSRLFNKADAVLEKRVGGKKELDRLVKEMQEELGEEWKNLATASKDDVVDLINTNICT